MAMSMYQASIPQFVKMLTNLSNILKKGEAFAKEKNIDGAVLVNDRLAPDMFPLSKQGHIRTFRFWSIGLLLISLPIDI